LRPCHKGGGRQRLEILPGLTYGLVRLCSTIGPMPRYFRATRFAALLCCTALPVLANPMERFGNALSVIDGRAAGQYAASARLRPDFQPGAQDVARFEGRYSGPWLDVARAAARRHGIPEDLFLRLVQQESAWDPQAVSHAGAIGLAQLMPDTARMLGVDPTDPVANLDAGARYLAMQFRSFRRWDHALAAYNAGPEAVRQHGGIPPFAETRDYVRIILGRG
jgi:soluble lytic murein transglycosylase-like protein